MRKKKWTRQQLILATAQSRSIRQILHKLDLKPAGGNYDQIKKYLEIYNVKTNHLKGRGWSRGLRGIGQPIIPLEKILVRNKSQA